MAGILINIDSDIEKLRRLKAEIEKVKSALKSIDVNIKVDMAADLEAKLKSLTSSYNAIISKVAEAEAKIMESEARIKKFTDSITDAQRKITQTAGMNTGTGTSASDTSAADNAQTASVDAQAKAYAELEREINGVIGTRYENIKRMIEEENAIRLVKAEIKQLLKYQTDGVPLSKEQSDLLVRLNSSLLTHKAALAEVRQTLSNNVKMDNAAATSMNALSQELSRMRIAYRELTEEERKSPFGKELLASIEQADAKIKGLDASIGNYQRNVGNYKSGFNGLNMSVQQIVRELPSATMGLNMFFLAISNNLPILTDEIKRAKAANDELKASGQKGVPVWKQLVSSLFSWQSAMMVGITLLSMYGKEFTKFISDLFKARKEVGLTEEAIKRMADATTSLNAELSKESSEIDKLFGKLAKARKGTGEYDEAKTAILNKYGKYLEGLSDEIRSLNDVAAAYDAVTTAANKSAKARALDRAKEQAENNYGDSIKELASDLIGEFTGAKVKGTVTELSEQEAARLTQKIISDIMDKGALSDDTTKSLRGIGTIKNDKGTYTGTGAGEINDLIDKTKEYRHELMITNAAFGEFENQFENMSIDELDKALKTLDKIEDILNKSGKGAKFTNKATGLEFDITNIRDLFHYREQIEAIRNKKNSEVQDVVEGGIVVTGNPADYKRNKQEKTDAEREQKEIEDARLKAEKDAGEAEFALKKKQTEDKIALIKMEKDAAIAAIDEQIKAAKSEEEKQALERKKTAVSISYDIDIEDETEAEEKEMEKSMNDYLKIYGDFAERRKAILASAEMKKDGKNEWEQKIIDKEAEKALKKLAAEAANTTSAIGNLFKDMGDKSVREMREIAEKGRQALELLSSGKWDENKGLELGISKDTFDSLSKSPEELDKIRKGIHNVETAADNCEGAIGKLVLGFKNLTSGNTKVGLEYLRSGLNDITAATSFLSDTFSDISDAFGSDVFGKMAEGLNVVNDAANSAMQGGLAGFMIGGPVGAGIGAAIGLVGSLASSIAKIHDNKIQERIEDLQDQIDALGKSYEKLDRIADKQYSNERADTILKQNENLEKQKELIEQQIAEEKSKKNPDEEALKQYQDQLDELDNQIMDNIDKWKESLTTISFDGFMSDFINTLSDMDSSSQDFADNFQNYLINAIMTSLVSKKYQSRLENLYNKFAEYADSDGQITQDEAAELRNEYNGIVEDATADREIIKDTFGFGESAEQQSASSRAFGTEMTQEQGSEISGRLTAMTESNIRLESVGQQQFIAITDIKGSMAGIATQLPMIYNVADESRRILADSYLELLSIRENTGAIVKPIKDIKSSISNIERKITNL